MPEKVREWLREHGKGDLQECSWAELQEALAYAGYALHLGAYLKRLKGEK